MAARIRKVLAEGPATGMGVAIALRMDSRRVNANLCDMYRSGHLARTPYYQTAHAGRRNVWLYALVRAEPKRPSGRAYGNRLPQSKVTPSLVVEIRRRHAEKIARVKELDAKYSIPAMAADLGLHPRTVQNIIWHKSWRHVA